MCAGKNPRTAVLQLPEHPDRRQVNLWGSDGAKHAAGHRRAGGRMTVPQGYYSERFHFFTSDAF